MKARRTKPGRTISSTRTRSARSPQALRAAFAVALGAGMLLHGGQRPVDEVDAAAVAPGGITLVSSEEPEPDTSSGDHSGSAGESTSDSGSSETSGSDSTASSGGGSSDSGNASEDGGSGGATAGSASETTNEPAGSSTSGAARETPRGSAATPSSGDDAPSVATAEPPVDVPPTQVGDLSTPPSGSASVPTATGPQNGTETQNAAETRDAPAPTVPPATGAAHTTPASDEIGTTARTADAPAPGSERDAQLTVGGAVERVVDEVTTALAASPVVQSAAATLAGLVGLGPNGPAEPGPAAALLLAAMARRGQEALTNGPTAARRGQVGEASTAMALAGAPVSGSATTSLPGGLNSVTTGPDGTTLYVLGTGYDAATSTSTSYLTVVDTTDPDAAPTTIAVPGHSPQVHVGADGSVTVVSESYDRAADTYTTNVTVVDAANGTPATTTVPGRPGRIVEGSGGSVSVVSYDYVYDSALDTNRDFTTYISTVDPADPGAEPVTIALVGSPHEVVPGPGGVLTVVTMVEDPDTRVRSAHITVVDPADRDVPPVTHSLPGDPRETIAGPGGTVVVVTSSYDAATQGSTTHLAVVDPADPTAAPITTTFPGQLVRTEARPDGTTAVVTYDRDVNTFTTHVAFVDLAEAAGPRSEVTLPGYITRIEPGPDGTTVVVAEQRDYAAGTAATTTSVAFVDTADPGATPVAVTLPGELDRPIEPGPDGTALVVTRAYDQNTSTATTHVALVDPRDTGATPVTAVLPGWNADVVHRTDGTIAAVTSRYDSTNRATTHVAVLDPDAPNAVVTSRAGYPRRVQLADGSTVTFLVDHDPATGLTRLTPGDVADPASSPGTAVLPGRVYEIESNADGTVTVATYEDGQGTSSGTTHIAVVDPADPAAARVVGDLPGSVYAVEHGPGGVLTVVTRESSSSDDGSVHVAVIDPTRPDATPVVTALPGRLLRVETSPDGTTTVVTLEEGPAGYVTHIAVVDPSAPGATPTVTDVPGVLSSVLDGADGVRYAFVSDYASSTTSVVTLDPSGAADPLALPGYLSSVQPGPNGTSYIATSTYDDATRTSRTAVFVFDPTSGGPTVTPVVADIQGAPYQITVNPQGVLTAITYDNAGSTLVTVVDTTDPGARSRVVSLPGYVDSYSTDPDGILTVTTREYDDSFPYTTHVAIVDTTDPSAVPATATLSAYDVETIVAGPDGTRYVISRNYDPTTGTETTDLTVLRVLPNSPPAPGDGPVAGQPGGDGAVVVDLGVTDPNGDALEVAVDPNDAPDPALGAVTVNPDGTVTYTPTAEARHDAARTAALGAGPITDTFTVLVSDGRGGQVPVLVTVTVAPGNVAPSAPTTLPTAPVTDRRRGGQVTGDAGLDDADGDDLTYAVDEQAEHGVVTVDGAGRWTYVPTPEARAAAAAGGPTTDSFTLTVDDGHGGVVAVPVTVAISPNEVPAPIDEPNLAVDPSTGVVTGGPVATDPDGDPLSYSLAEGGEPARGTVTFDEQGRYTYTPTEAARHEAAATGSSGATTMMARRVASLGGPTTDTFVVDVVDDAGLHTLVTVTVPITPLNAGPTAPASPSAPTTDAATGAVTGDLGVTDPDGDSLGYSVGTNPARGSVSVDPASGRWTYTPTDAARRAAATGGPTTDTFTVLVSDGHGGVLPVPVTVTITPLAPTVPTPPAPPRPGHPKPGHPKPRPCPPGADHTSPAHHDRAHARHHHWARDDHGPRRWMIDLVRHRASLVPTRVHAAADTDQRPTVQVYGLGGRYLWVLDPTTGVVTVVDTRTERVIARISVGGDAVGLTMSSDGTRLTVSHADGDETVIDTGARRVLEHVPG